MPGVKFFPKPVDPLAHLRYESYKAKLGFGLGNRNPVNDLKQSSWTTFGFEFDKDESPRKFIAKALDIVEQVYLDDLGSEVGDCFLLLEEIRDTVDLLDDGTLNFIVSWPQTRECFLDLAYAIENSMPLYPRLENLQEFIDQALTAKQTGIFIPGTEVFVNHDDTQPTPEVLYDLGEAVKMLDDTGYPIRATAFLNLSNFLSDDYYAIAWRGGSLLTEMEYPVANDLIINPKKTLAQYIAHEETHHRWDVAFPDGVTLDPELVFDGGSYLAANDSLDEVIGEILANSLDTNIALRLRGQNDLIDSGLILERSEEIDRVIFELSKPKFKGAISPEGLRIIDAANEYNRTNKALLFRKPR